MIWDELHYVSGDPDIPEVGGYHHLLVRNDRSLVVGVVKADVSKRFEGSVLPAFSERLEAGLADAGFPLEPPSEPRVHNETFRNFWLQKGEEVEAVVLGWNQAERLPGWRELFALLDSVITQACGADLAVAPNVHPPLVEGIHEAPIPTV